MISSGLFARSAISLEVDQVELTGTVRASMALPAMTSSNSVKVEKSTNTYLIHSYLYFIFKDESKSLLEKHQSCRQLGRKLGSGYIEILTEGMVEKLLYSRDGKSVKTQQQIKFICENLWPQLYGKKMDKLHYSNGTNTFTFSDFDFRLLRHISHPDSQKQVEFATLNMEVAAGIIEGAMARFGHDADVKYSEVDLKGEQQLKTQVKFEVRCRNVANASYFCTY